MRDAGGERKEEFLSQLDRTRSVVVEINVWEGMQQTIGSPAVRPSSDLKIENHRTDV